MVVGDSCVHIDNFSNMAIKTVNDKIVNINKGSILKSSDVIFNIDSENKVDLTARSRNKAVEADCECAQDYLNLIIGRLSASSFDMNDTVLVIDDLGMGKIEIPYTYGSLLAQANSHTIHHYAIINYIFDSLGIVITDSDFGYNPTTPKHVSAE